MGMIRKITSASTLGAVDYRSDKERIAKNTKGMKKAVKAQTRQQAQIAQQQMEAQTAMQAQAAAAAPPQPTYPPSPSIPTAAVPVPDLMEQLRQLGEMKTAGMLTDEEFAAAKAKLLG